MTVPATEPAVSLVNAVSTLRDEVAQARFPLDLHDTDSARRTAVELVRQLDDYVLPRLMSLDAPLLAVVGGSTGAGKSTLVNSLIGGVVSRAGVIRPTTTAPVLVHHPDDLHWFDSERVLPMFARVTGELGPEAAEDPSALRLVPSETLPAGIALLDAPDIDSVVSANRALANQLLAAADLWLFVTTAARYADAVPWALLRQAGQRGTSVAVVLDRAPTVAVEEVRVHLGSMLRRQELAEAPIFTILESNLDHDGLLPPVQTERLRRWLAALAADGQARSEVIHRTLDGVLGSLGERAGGLVDATATQVQVHEMLRHSASAAYADATRGVSSGMSDGTLLRGEVLARWQEYVGTGEFFRQVETAISRMRDRLTAAMRSGPVATEPLGEALGSGVASLVKAQAHRAAASIARAWEASSAGAALIEAHPELMAAGPELSATIERMVRDWQGQILELVHTEGQDRRTKAKTLAYGVNGVSVILMLVAFAATGGLTGAEVGIAGGSALLAQKLLEGIFGDEAVRRLANRARQSLLAGVEKVYDDELDRYLTVLSEVAVPRDQGNVLAAAVEAVTTLR